MRTTSRGKLRPNPNPKENSIEKSEALCDEALLHDPDSAEACQALADLRLSQNRRVEALMFVKKTLEICNRIGNGMMPSFDFRTVIARLLVELSQYELATSLLKELEVEDEEDTEIWYLLGMCVLMLGRTATGHSALRKAKQKLEDNQLGNSALLKQITLLLHEMKLTEER